MEKKEEQRNNTYPEKEIGGKKMTVESGFRRHAQSFLPLPLEVPPASSSSTHLFCSFLFQPK
ncbi:hypothetical protein CDL15_Pgr016283 [Punica granatum]|uniref:Uncharacterized protein n=1 Tax=Punica granatum TaxID=22663 RepID=A0A218XHK3_PUNGR|nr:hypothetical protein CDL15_Pgr016283 [Punica granatum]